MGKEQIGVSRDRMAAAMSARAPRILAGLLAIALAGCGKPDRMLMIFDTKTGQPLPDALPTPEKWVFLGTQTVPGKGQTMTWVEPVHMQTRRSAGTPEQAAGMLGKPRDAAPGEWSDSFEY